MNPTRLTLTRLTLAVLSLTASSLATAASFTWTGASTGGFWDQAQNWGSGVGGLPQASDDVLLGNADTHIRTTFAIASATGTGRLSLDAGAALTMSNGGTLGALSLLRGQLINHGSLLVNGETSWIATLLRGPGVTRFNGDLTLSSTAFDGATTVLGGHTVTLAATTRYIGVRGLSIGEGSQLVNEGSWLDQAGADVNFGNFNGGANGVFVNQGSYHKTSAFRTEIGNGLRLDNTGSVNVNAGLLRISGAGSRSSGSLNVAAGAELSLLSSDMTLGGSVSNRGTFSFDGGVVTLAGDLNLQGDGLTRLRGTIRSTGAFVINGSTEWIDAAFSGTGRTLIDGPLTVSGTSSHSLLGGHTLELAGSTTQTGTGGISTGGASRLINRGSWIEAANGNVNLGNFNGGASSQFDNVGSFTKTSTFVTDIGNGLTLNNTGRIDVQAGTLQLSGNATLSAAGQVSIASGATLGLRSGSIALGGTVQNAGTLALSGATVAIADRATVQGGLTTFRGTVSNTGHFVINGSAEWATATFTGTGSTLIDGPLTVSGTSSRSLLGGHTLELAGSTTQTGTGSLSTGGASRLINRGNWIEAANGNVNLGNFNGGASSQFDNVGSFTKTSTFVTDIGNGLTLNNTGRIDVQAGTLRLSSAFTNQGQIDLAAGAELASTATAFANAGTLAGDGTVRTAGTTFSLSNAGTLAAGGLDDAGTLSLIGGLTQQAAGTVIVDLGGTSAGSFDLLTVSGNAILTGTLAVNLLAGAQFNVGDSFTVMTWGQRVNNSQFASLDLSQAGGYSFAADYDANSLTLRVVSAPVPEPGSWALMAVGLAGLGLRARRRAGSVHAV